MTTERPPLITVTDAATLLGVSRQRVLSLIDRGTLTPAHTYGAHGGRVAVYLLDRTAVEQYATNRHQPRSNP